MNKPNRPEPIKFNDIKTPGSYITQQGSLFQVEAAALRPNQPPLISIHSNLDTRMTKISDDPQLSKVSAAKLARDWDLPVNFPTDDHHVGAASSASVASL